MRFEREMEVLRTPDRYIDSYQRHIRWEGAAEADGSVAAMFPEDIARLCEYSASVPTGVRDGKVWKARYDSGWVLCQYVHVAGTDEWFIQRNPIREIGVLERRRLQAEAHLAELQAQCDCGGLGLQLGGWMGPTRRAPYPRRCACSPEITSREVQLRWANYLASLPPDTPVPGLPTFPVLDAVTRWYNAVCDPTPRF